MFGGRARNGFGLGLVVGICLTLVFCILTTFGGQPVAQSESAIEQTQDNFSQQNDPIAGLELDGIIATSEDTLANWVMAIFSVLAVMLLWRTLYHTRVAARHTEGMLAEAKETTRAAHLSVKAAEEANAQAARMNDQAVLASELDARAYLAASSVKLLAPDDGDCAFVEFTLLNVGKSPAHNIAAVKFVFCDDIIGLGPFDGKIPRGSHEFPMIATLVPGSSDVCKVPIFLDQTYDGRLSEVSGGVAQRLEIMVAYQTVFDRLRKSYSGEVALVIDIDWDDFKSVETYGEVPVESFSASHRPSWMDGYLNHMENTFGDRFFEQFQDRIR
jgi:hypothetical protein